MSDFHSFDVLVAKQLKSVEQAILMTYFKYWHEINMEAGRNYRKGKYWTYNTLEEFGKIYPYWSEKQIRTLIDHLKKAGYITTDQPGGSVRTVHYALTAIGCVLAGVLLDNQPSAQTGSSICPFGQMEVPERADGSAQIGKCICPNGQMLYKDTISTTVTTAVTTQTKGESEKNDVGDEEKKENPPPPPPPRRDPFSFRSDSEKVNVPFSVWWPTYQKDIGEDQCRKLWLDLTDEERLKAQTHTPPYVKSTPDKKYRLKPANYLADKSFNDEIIDRHETDANATGPDKNGHREIIRTKYAPEKFGRSGSGNTERAA